MNYRLCLLFLLVIFGLSSCNQEKIEELENKVMRLKTENKALKSQIEELEKVILNYENYRSAQNHEQEQINWHLQNAQQHIRIAEFFRQAGDDFLYESHMRNAQQELEMIH